ncbi:LuxR C-terminal-related transcriptional regulator [Kitasatospora purpeofusca]|uniref:LuxR C-terminal-related transcriptional regulator n=1 Tax=Kitasatospora purpeofusca TaxID=67352 RepID=UPI0035DBF6B2
MRIKSLHQDATRHDPHTTTYAHWLVSPGSEVRTAPTLPQRLGFSTRTVSRHMTAIMERLNATSRFEAGLKAAQQDWL